jgi:lysozyme
MNYSDLIIEIKKDEGFRAKPYKCSEGFPTIGYGTKLPLNEIEKTFVKNPDNITELEADKLLSFRLEKSIKLLESEAGHIISKLSDARKKVIYNMLYQLGIKGVLNFKKMWTALEAKDFAKAADEMKESRWFNQTPKRAGRLINRMLEG